MQTALDVLDDEGMAGILGGAIQAWAGGQVTLPAPSTITVPATDPLSTDSIRFTSRSL